MKLAWGLVIFVAACGGGSTPGGDGGKVADGPTGGDGGPTADAPGPLADAPAPAQSYEPIVVGASWTYLDTDPMTGATAVKTTTVEAYEQVGVDHPGKIAYRVRGDKLGGTTVSWEEYEGTKVVRYAQKDYLTDGTTLVDSQSEAPYRLKIDQAPALLMTGATYSESFTETTTTSTGTMTRPKTATWTVINGNEMVTVPAGTFMTVHVQRVSGTTTTKTKDFWFAQGVGKVKESGGAQESQELMSYTIP